MNLENQTTKEENTQMNPFTLAFKGQMEMRWIQ